MSFVKRDNILLCANIVCMFYLQESMLKIDSSAIRRETTSRRHAAPAEKPYAGRLIGSAAEPRLARSNVPGREMHDMDARFHADRDRSLAFAKTLGLAPGGVVALSAR